MDAYDIYSRQLYSLKRGHALYEPDPAGEYDFVRVGDVGHIIRGSYHRAFNIFCAADDTINALGVPEDFEPCPMLRPLTHRRTRTQAGPLYSTHVREHGTTFDVSGCANYNSLSEF